jgi:uncharacterized protein with GYD domain
MFKNENKEKQEDRTMATYISLEKFTQSGVATINERPTRFKLAKQAVKAAGVDFKAFYLTMG